MLLLVLDKKPFASQGTSQSLLLEVADHRPMYAVVTAADRLPDSPFNAECRVVEQIIEKSRQEQIMLHCPDDAKIRFKDETAFLQWGILRKTAMTCLMVDKEAAGSIFFRQKENPRTLSTITFGVRLFDGWRGRGLAVPFMKLMHDWLLQTTTRPDGLVSFEAPQGVWLEVDSANHTAQALYSRFGYETQAIDHESKRILMTYDGR